MQATKKLKVKVHLSILSSIEKVKVKCEEESRKL